MKSDYLKKLSFGTKVSRFFMNWIFLMMVWLGFTNSFAPQELYVGIGLTALMSFLGIRLFTCCDLSLLSPVKMFWMVYYFGVFLVALVQANLDVARRDERSVARVRQHLGV